MSRADIKAIIRRYPQHKAELAALRSASGSGGNGHGTEVHRVTEDLAMRMLPRQDQRELDAVEFAIRATQYNYGNGNDRLRLINLLYWSPDRYNLQGAAMLIPCSVQTAKFWHNDFVQRVDMSLMVMAVKF